MTESSKEHLNEYLSSYIPNETGMAPDTNFTRASTAINYIAFKYKNSQDGLCAEITPGYNYFVDISPNSGHQTTGYLMINNALFDFAHSEIVISYVESSVLFADGAFVISTGFTEEALSAGLEKFKNSQDPEIMLNIHDLSAFLVSSGFYRFSLDQFNAIPLLEFMEYRPYNTYSQFGSAELLNSSSNKQFYYPENTPISSNTNGFKHTKNQQDSNINI